MHRLIGRKGSTAATARTRVLDVARDGVDAGLTTAAAHARIQVWPDSAGPRR